MCRFIPRFGCPDFIRCEVQLIRTKDGKMTRNYQLHILQISY